MLTMTTTLTPQNYHTRLHSKTSTNNVAESYLALQMKTNLLGVREKFSVNVEGKIRHDISICAFRHRLLHFAQRQVSIRTLQRIMEIVSPQYRIIDGCNCDVIKTLNITDNNNF